MEERAYIKSKSGATICGILVEEGCRCAVLLCHGFGSNKNSNTNMELAKKLKGKADSLRIDFYGHGESEGLFEDISVSKGVEDVVAGIRFLRKKGYDKVGLVGSSFGGLCSILAASRERVDFVALKAPACDMKETEEMILGKEGVKEWKKRGYTYYFVVGKGPQKLNYGFYKDAVGKDAYKEARKIKAPVLIVHGDRDKVVPVEQGRKLEKSINGAKLVVVKGADHNFSEEKHFKEMIGLIYSFIVENCG
ncbi:MAG: alpha/beta hydrolase [Candidatus Anstonellales archaeon]